MYTKQQEEAALREFERTGSVQATIQTLGYPSRSTLYRWFELKKAGLQNNHGAAKVTDASANKTHFGDTPEHPRHPSVEVKMEALHRCFELGEDVEYVAREIGYSRASIYMWRRQYIKRGTLALMTTKDLPRGKFPETNSPDVKENRELKQLKEQVSEIQLEVDLLKETIHVLKKDPGVDLKELSNREKTAIVDVLKPSYPLSLLMEKLSLAKSSYYYQKQQKKKPPKLEMLRNTMRNLFYENYSSYGYRRMKEALKHSGIVISEKVVRRIMQEENLHVIYQKKRHDSSYQGEITPAAPDLLKRDFHAGQSNQKWLTDITEMAIPAGKIYVSAIVDCYDGLIVACEARPRSDANLVNHTLDQAIETLAGSHPILHSDRGCHYRWPGWLNRISDNSLIRSMSRKGCSPDNAAGEGFWGRMKNECFYGRSFQGYSVEQFISYLYTYIDWYNNKRIKMSLSGQSPVTFRQKEGLMI